MNKVILIGRLVRELELKYTNTEKAFLRFTLAVNRRSKEDGADFISCVAWTKTAELMAKYVGKGDRVAVIGRIQTGSYEDRDGKKIYTTDVVADEIEFLETRKKEEKQGFTPATTDPFEVEDEGLPFNPPF